MKTTGLKNIDQVRVTGGGARSPIWRQILADVFNAEIVTVNTTEGAAYGAALLAATGSGEYNSVEAACDAAIKITGSTESGADQSIYNDIYPLYRQLYPALSPTFNKIGA
jgi:xylulokinase